MKIKLVLVEPEGRINTGFIFRLAKNFNIEDICIVRPSFDLHDEEVVNFAAGGRDLINRAIIAGSIEECIQDVDISVCTTAKASYDTDVLRQSIHPRLLSLIYDNYKIALVFGRESVGLTREELRKCDLVSTLPLKSDYNVLNLSHAVALYLYELASHDRVSYVLGQPCPEDQLKVIRKYLNMLESLVESKEGVLAIRHIFFRALLTKAECGAIYGLLKELYYSLRR